MMKSPEMFLKQIEDASYTDLIKGRDAMIRYLRHYEKLEKAGDRSGPEWQIHPLPDVRYQMYMDYLVELIQHMRKKYNTEYVWGDKTLNQKRR